MVWKQCSTPVGPAFTDIQMLLVGILHRMGYPPGFALFGRTADGGKVEVLLLSPDAVEILGNTLPPNWVELAEPENFTWTLLYGPSDSLERLGLNSGSETASKSRVG